ncbi:hypothetical protein EVAR_98068_1 [Eumeta japonica]|uniref:Uncharacterized protein n=1 Tax=Eumeta variegata TaxID=151549 RepID=A0A4C1WFD0_EUMVA|nr:hypothetical protein EVAR_98068_1 [Eumeta japonica]
MKREDNVFPIRITETAGVCYYTAHISKPYQIIAKAHITITFEAHEIPDFQFMSDSTEQKVSIQRSAAILNSNEVGMSQRMGTTNETPVSAPAQLTECSAAVFAKRNESITVGNGRRDESGVVVNLAVPQKWVCSSAIYHTLTEYRRKVTASAVVFRLMSESSGGPLSSPSPEFPFIEPLLSIYSPSDILFLPKGPETQC